MFIYIEIVKKQNIIKEKKHENIKQLNNNDTNTNNEKRK